jgi:hypothetical protein
VIGRPVDAASTIEGTFPGTAEGGEAKTSTSMVDGTSAAVGGIGASSAITGGTDSSADAAAGTALPHIAQNAAPGFIGAPHIAQ